MAVVIAPWVRPEVKTRKNQTKRRANKFLRNQRPFMESMMKNSRGATQEKVASDFICMYSEILAPQALNRLARPQSVKKERHI